MFYEKKAGQKHILNVNNYSFSVKDILTINNLRKLTLN